jgi:hypothetical protein
VVSAELTAPRGGRLGTERVLRVTVAAWVAAVLAIVLVALIVGCIPGTTRLAHDAFGISLTVGPHSTSGRSVGYALRVFFNNTLLALWPLTGLYLLRDVPGSWWRVWNGLVVLIAVRNIAPVPAALGVWGVRVLPYIPNAPRSSPPRCCSCSTASANSLPMRCCVARSRSPR